MQGVVYVILLLLVVSIAVYFYLYYPQQSMPIGESIDVRTIESEKYHDDCLHPCIRHDAQSGKYYMAQSPYYGVNNKVENPMFYVSKDYKVWKNGILIADTPDKGFNSDPNILLTDSGKVFFIWRECKSTLCEKNGGNRMVVGGILEGGRLNRKRVYAINSWERGDYIQCPTLIERNGKYYIYAAWYQYEPARKNMGIAIWEGTSLDNPDFRLLKTIPFRSVYTVDRMAQLRLFRHLWYIPKPLHHDMWHFDLFEYSGKLYMVSVSERGDNVMLSVAEDWKHFRTIRKPLINNHYTENHCNYRQYYYKPTAFVTEDTLHVFYTANAKDDPNKNQLYHSSAPIKEILK